MNFLNAYSEEKKDHYPALMTENTIDVLKNSIKMFKCEIECKGQEKFSI